MGLILASGSPRRSLLLSLSGIAFTTVQPDVDETPFTGEAPAEYVTRLSDAKAHAVPRSGADVVLAADTTVVFAGAIIGKPSNPLEAVTILTQLAGETHSVLTGWTITDGDTHRFGVEESRVRFNEHTHDELADYVERTQPFDKAGAYALQGDDGWLVASVSGSRSNVMGLPIREVVDALKAFGIERSTP
ncbi:MAG: Maf family protein [Actinomycetota bacterium]